MTEDPQTRSTARLRRLLQVEDVETDAELILRELRRHGLSFESCRVWTEAGFLEALATFAPDVILSDFSMPAFNGLHALRLARELAPNAPFIFVSGSIRAEDAANALDNGALAYLHKDDLVPLGPAVEKALRSRP